MRSSPIDAGSPDFLALVEAYVDPAGERILRGLIPIPSLVFALPPAIVYFAA